MEDSISTTKTITYVLCIVIYSFSSSYLAYESYSSLSPNVDNFVDITRNWQSKAIMEIQVFKNNCPKDYEEAFKAEWPGIKDGCWCGGIDSEYRDRYKIYYDIYEESCDGNQTISGCKNIPAISAKPLSLISKLENEKGKICIKRSNETWAQTALNSNSTCPTGTIKCGLSENNIFCSNSSQCPINHIDIVNVESIEDVENCIEANNCTVLSKESSHTRLLKYKRGDTHDALPLAQFRLNEYRMCRDSTKDNKTPGRFDFELSPARSTCKVDEQGIWEENYSLTEAELFDLNGLTYTINSLQKYDYYPKGINGQNYMWHLFSRNYIPWKLHCRSRMNEVVESSGTMNKLKETQKILMIATILAGVILGLFLPYMICANLCKSLENTDYHKQEIKTLVLFGKRLGNFVKFFQIPLQTYTLYVSFKTKQLFKGLVNDACSGVETLSTIRDLVKELESLYSLNLWNVGLLVLFCISGCIFYFEKQKKRLGQGESEHDEVVAVNYYDQPVQQNSNYAPPSIL